MARRARATAAYATCRVLDPATGAPTVLGFHQGGTFPDTADPDNVENLVRRGYAEWVDEADGPADPGATIGEPELVVTGDPVRPADNALKPAWVDYAVAMRDEGVSEEDARAEAEATKKDDLIARFPAE